MVWVCALVLHLLVQCIFQRLHVNCTIMYGSLHSELKLCPWHQFFLLVCYRLVTLLSKANRASVITSTYQQARCSGVHPSVLVQIGLHFRSSVRYLARGRCPFLKLRISSRMVIYKPCTSNSTSWPYPSIWRTLKPFFHRIRLIRCAYKSLRRLHLEIWRFFC